MPPPTGKASFPRTAQSASHHLFTCSSLGKAILLPQRTQIGDPWNVVLKHTRDLVFVLLDSSMSSTKDADASHEILHFFVSPGLFSVTWVCIPMGQKALGLPCRRHSLPFPQPTSCLSLQPAPVSLRTGVLVVNICAVFQQPLIEHLIDEEGFREREVCTLTG